MVGIMSIKKKSKKRKQRKIQHEKEMGDYDIESVIHQSKQFKTTLEIFPKDSTSLSKNNSKSHSTASVKSNKKNSKQKNTIKNAQHNDFIMSINAMNACTFIENTNNNKKIQKKNKSKTLFAKHASSVPIQSNRFKLATEPIETNNNVILTKPIQWVKHYNISDFSSDEFSDQNNDVCNCNKCYNITFNLFIYIFTSVN